MCAANDPHQYVECQGTEWAELSCEGTTTCNQKTSNKVECLTAGQKSGSEEKSADTSVKCSTAKATMCIDNTPDSYYECIDSTWRVMSCGSGTECRVVDNKAVCADPSAPTENTTKEPAHPCKTNNATMCNDTDRSSFYMCVDNNWENMQCDDANVCMVRGGKTSCVDRATADAPVQKCSTEKATRCVSDNKETFQICSDGYWANSTCTDGNYCLFRSNSASCVDKETAEAPVVPCSKNKATRCLDDQPTSYQMCSDGFWVNSKCDSGNYCLFRSGTASCVDKETAEAPIQPCKKAKDTRCVEESKAVYQICYEGFWSNSTCDGDNVCRMEDGQAACVDKDYVDPSTIILHSPTPFLGYTEASASGFSMGVWGLGTALGTVAVILGLLV
ncbi:hypothetical protein GGF46_000085 [Coemansia sp. RSA 552]|nr:hypothetical protein GGF46_000085 [Coemansia sp. RSA 552]